MMIKISSVLLVAAAVLPSTLASLQCNLQTTYSNIIGIQVFSAPDLAGQVDPSDRRSLWADVTLAEHYHTDIEKATHHITMRHNGRDCRQVKKAKDNICNEGYVAEFPGNSCAQVIHRSHLLGWDSGKALDISQEAPNSAVHFSAILAPSLQYWRAGIFGSCADQVFDAPDNGMKVLAFSASTMHRWNRVVVTLDEADEAFATSWQCEHSSTLMASTPLFSTSDYKVWTITRVSFDPRLY